MQYTAYSGNDTNKNNVCSIGTPRVGPVPPGNYTLGAISCKIGARDAHRVFTLIPALRFTNTSGADGIFANLSLFSDADGTAAGSSGIGGIVTTDTLLDLLTTGDTIKVTLVATDACVAKIKACKKYPPPSIGDVTVTNEATANVFRFNFRNWGGDATMNRERYAYSVAINNSNNFIELCSGTPDITANGILCNAANAKKLGYFNSGRTYFIRYRVKYSFTGLTADGVFSEIMKTIDIQNVTTTDNAATILAGALNKTTVADLLDELNYRQQAQDSMVAKPPVLNKTTTCSADLCKNGGNCTIVQQLPRCRCTMGYAGLDCSVTADNMQKARVQSEQAANNVLTLATNASTDPSSIVKAIAAVTANTDAVSLPAALSSLKALDYALNSSTADTIDSASLQTAIQGILSSLVKGVVAERMNMSNQTLSTDDKTKMKSNNTERLGTMKVVKRAMQKLISLNADSIQANTGASNFSMEGQMNSFFFPSTMGQATVDGATVNTSTASLLFSMTYPPEVGDMFPPPDNLTNGTTYVMASNVISISSQSTTSPYGEIEANKTITFAKGNLVKRRLADTTSRPVCGYTDESTSAFSSTGCTTSTSSSGDISCSCVGKSNSVYVVYASATRTVIYGLLMILAMGLLI